MATSNANVNLPRLSSWITWYIRGLKTTTTSRNILFLLRPILNMATALWEEENEIKITLWKCAEILQPLMHVVKRGWKDWGRSYWAQTSCDFLRCNKNTCRPLPVNVSRCGRTCRCIQLGLLWHILFIFNSITLLYPRFRSRDIRSIDRQCFLVTVYLKEHQPLQISVVFKVVVGIKGVFT